jgi:hypothetical protein
MKRFFASKGFAVFLTILIVAPLAAASAYVWENGRANDQQTVLKGQIDTLRLQVSDLQAAQTTAPPPPPTAAAPSDNDLVIAAVKANCSAPNGIDISKGSFAVKKLTAPFATATVNCTGSAGGALTILKKVNGSWVIIYQGQQAPGKDIIDKYAIPKDFQS